MVQYNVLGEENRKKSNPCVHQSPDLCLHLDCPTPQTNNTQQKVSQEYEALPIPSSNKDMLSRTRWRIPQQCWVPRSWPSGVL